MQKLRILSVGYPLATVGPDAVGGAEQILFLLDRGLVAAEHDSLVIAPEGSGCAGRLLPLPPLDGGVLTPALRARVQRLCRDLLHRTLAEEPVDLVHLHGVDFHRYLPPPGTAALATLHLPPGWYPDEVLRSPPDSLHLQCVSDSQRSACPAGVPIVATIGNGIQVDSFGPPRGERSFALMLGRICPEKGFHLGLEAARRAGMDALLCGEIHPYPEHQEYFAGMIAPRLDDRRRFLGPVGLERKQELLARARCVLIPSLAPETSSLVAMEACASGTPVIAFRVGALPEIVEEGRTGMLVENASEMADALRTIGQIDPERCRARARERFGAGAMVARYLELYHELARRARPQPGGPDAIAR